MGEVVSVNLAEPRFIRTFEQAGRPGAYLRVLEEGEVRTGDRVEVQEASAGAPPLVPFTQVA